MPYDSDCPASPNDKGSSAQEMQDPFSPLPNVLTNIRVALAPARLDRYLAAASGDRLHALRLYAWNAELAASFLVPLQIGEVALRNRIHAGLSNLYRSDWHLSGPVRANLEHRYVRILDDSVKATRARHGPAWTINNMVADLPFGFWIHVMRPKNAGIIWRSSLSAIFPGIPSHVTDRDIFDLTDPIRHFRNRVAHHKPIFDKAPQRIYSDLLTLIGWCCADTRWLAQHLSRVTQTLARRPRA